jgi:hypothetical protein
VADHEVRQGPFFGLPVPFPAPAHGQPPSTGSLQRHVRAVDRSGASVGVLPDGRLHLEGVRAPRAERANEGVIGPKNYQQVRAMFDAAPEG